MKNKINFLITLIAISLLNLSFVSAISMTRDVPSTVTIGGTFTLTYTVSGAIGTWGASIIDSISGGCTFPDGTTSYKSVMLSPDGNTKSITITAPSSGSCVFSGDYKFGTDPIVSFPSATVTISGICTPNCVGKECGDDGCGGSCGICSSGKVCSNGQCITCTIGQTCIASNGCSGTCVVPEFGGNTCVTSLKKCSDGTCKTDCPVEECNEFFSDTMNWYKFTDNDCTNGYIITGILGIVGLFIIIKLLK